MIGIVIVAHGGLAGEYLSAVEHVVGKQTGMLAIPIEPDHDRDRKQSEICAAADSVDTGDGVVVVTTPEAIVSATRYGGEIMMMGDELGLVKEGYLADLLLVAGDPLTDITLLQDRHNLLAIMKDGTFYKRPDPETLAAEQAA